MVKVLLVSDYVDSYWWAEKVLNNMFDELKKLEYEIEIFWSHSKNVQSSFFGFLNIKILLQFKRKLQENKFDIIHIHKFNNYLSPFVFYIASIYSWASILFHAHDFSLYCYWLWVTKTKKECEWWLFHWSCATYVTRGRLLDMLYWCIKFLKLHMNRYFIRKYVDVIISPSRKLNSCMKEVFWTKKKYYYIPNYIDIVHWKTDTISCESMSSFLFVWRLSYEKWIDVAIRACHVLVKKWYTWILLTVIWDWPQKDILEKLVDDLELNKNIIFIWKVDNAHLHTYYKKSLWVVMPSIRMENNPLVCLEALSFWKPILATDIWWYPDLVEHWKSWFLFDINNSVLLSDYMEQFLTNKIKAKEMWTYWKDIILQRFSKENFYDSLESVYKTHLWMLS